MNHRWMLLSCGDPKLTVWPPLILISHGGHEVRRRNRTAAAQIVSQGISSFKIFLAYQGAFGIDDEELFKTLKLAKELGVIVTAHCENATAVAQLQNQLIAAGKTGPGS